MSGIPISKFHLLAKTKIRNAPITPAIMAANIIQKVSTALKNDLYNNAPIILQTAPTKIRIAKTNLDMCITSNKKKYANSENEGFKIPFKIIKITN
jgi:hypothetical protein